MSTNGGDSHFPTSKPSHSGVKVVLQYTGIPPSWLDKRPGIPSRNWLIFLTVTSTITGYYFYDRKKCKDIRQEYVDKVKHLADTPLHSMDHPRKVTVYGCKWPGDDDSTRSMLYFRRYVKVCPQISFIHTILNHTRKPMLVAAAIDYEMINGRRHGDLADRIANDIKKRRRLEAGIDQLPPAALMLPNNNPEAKRLRELEGGTIIVGRPAFKEYMMGLKRGWTENLEFVDKEERLANELVMDGKFDEPELDITDGIIGDGEPIPTPSKLQSSKPMSMLSPPLLKTATPSMRSPHQTATSSSQDAPPPATLPPQPPILLVSFLNHIGLRQIPLMVWDFFNERHKARSGAEAAYRLILGETRPLIGPSTVSGVEDGFESPYQTDVQSSPDLDFDKDKEGYYKPSVVKTYASEIQNARDEYYKELPKKLNIARELAHGTREATKDEQKYPPPTEVELRAERLKKELRWTSDEKGWAIVKPDSPVTWDERFRHALQVYTDPSAEREGAFQEQAAQNAEKQ